MTRCPVCDNTFDETVSHRGVTIRNKAWRTFCSPARKTKKNNTPERQRKYRLKRAYGISQVEYDRMLQEQGGVCAICKQAPEEGKRALHVDHCHKTEVNRGILCTWCNPGLGYFRDDVELLKAAIKYLEGTL